MTTSDTKTLAQASLFRRMRALCWTMQKTKWEFRKHLYGYNNKSNFIRQKGEEDSCPLTFTWFVASGQNYYSRDWQPVSRKLGFRFREAEIIILAADHGGPDQLGKRAQMRRILLRAAGLKEQP